MAGKGTRLLRSDTDVDRVLWSDLKIFFEGEVVMNGRKVGRIFVYAVGFVATTATSPSYEYFGTTAFDQRSVNLTTEVVHVPIQAAVEFANPAEAEPFDYCGWDVVVEFNEPITLETEVVLWGLNSQWDQSAFDDAYAAALVSATDDLEEGDTASPMDTGDFDILFTDRGYG